MDGDPGLSQEPWVRVELRDGGVQVDGVPVQLAGSAEDRYLAALQQVARDVAAPLGRRVGVTVMDASGVVAHLAIHPDGSADSIDDLVRAARSPVVVPQPRGPVVAQSRGVTVAAADPGGGSRARRLRVLLGAAGLAAVLVTGIAVLSEAVGGSPSGPAAQEVLQDTPVAAAADLRDVSPGALLQRRLRLEPVVVADGPCRVRITLRPAARPTQVTVRLRPADGPVVQRRLMLEQGARSLVLTDVAPGPARWHVSAPGARQVSGRIEVMPPPADAAAASAPPATVSGTQAVERPRSGRAGRSDAAPLIPVDPDDR